MKNSIGRKSQTQKFPNRFYQSGKISITIHSKLRTVQRIIATFSKETKRNETNLWRINRRKISRFFSEEISITRYVQPLKRPLSSILFRAVLCLGNALKILEWRGKENFIFFYRRYYGKENPRIGEIFHRIWFKIETDA